MDVCIEFSTPQTVLQNIRVAVQARKDIVVGTTGWYDRLPEIRPLVKDSGLLYSPNFSIGVNMVFRLAAAAAEMMNNAPAYDPYIHEWHHRQKADSPSGTALRLAEILLSKVERKKTIKKENVDGKIDPAALHVSSTRVGTVPGNTYPGLRIRRGFYRDQACCKITTWVCAGRGSGRAVAKGQERRLHHGRRRIVGAVI